MKIRKNDTVKVLTGKDKGKSGKVLKLSPSDGRVIVEGVNFVKKHARKSQNNPQGGIISREGSVNVSNLAVVCNRCSKSTRIGFSTLSDGTKTRVCKLCKETL
ncbi:50S ribosomal protein L24 [Candidatus Omnitrophota bacterium]